MTAAGLLGATRLHHVAYVVEDLDAAVAWHERLLGAHVELRARLDDQAVEAAALRVGDGEVELIAPTDETSGVARFLARRGPGLHHVAWEVEDVAAALDRLRDEGIRLIDEAPRTGLHGVPIAFVHPTGTFGVLTELVQAPAPASARETTEG